MIRVHQQELEDKQYFVPDLCNKTLNFWKEKEGGRIRNIELHANGSVQSLDSTRVWKVIPR